MAGLILSSVPSMLTPEYPALRSAHQDRQERSKGEADECGGRNHGAPGKCDVSGMSEMWLQEMLETDRGIAMALEHFVQFVARLEGEARRAEMKRQRVQRQVEELSKTCSELCAVRPLDTLPEYWHSKFSAELEDAEADVLHETVRRGELLVLQKRVTWELQQTQKAVGNKESDLKGYMQDVRTLSLQLNEAQVEASHAFACLEQQCTIVATQKANMTHAALQRRRVFKSRADAALVQVTLARCKHREHNAQVAKQVQTVKLQQRQHVLTMLRSLIYLTPAANPN